jgi:hypothetical protein
LSYTLIFEDLKFSAVAYFGDMFSLENKYDICVKNRCRD